MTIFYINRHSLFLLLFLPFLSWSQGDFTGYWEPGISINYGVVGDYSHNFSLKQRNYFYADNQFNWTVKQLDLAHFSKLKIKGNQSIALGIQYRFRDIFENNENELRFTQQYGLLNTLGTWHLGHRFRAEQRIRPSLSIHRFRYRVFLEIPLQGEKLDVGESYMVLGVENLLSMAKTKKTQYDTRLTAEIGWLLNKGTKLQIGSEYRLENYTNSLEKSLFLLTSLNLRL